MGEGGNLQIILRLRLKSIFNSYTVIDIPKFLVLNAFCTSEFFKSIRLSFPKKKELINPENSNLFISSGEYSDFFETNKDLYFDLVLNTQSFMEMSNNIVSDYFNLIYERANTNCLFFQSNFRQYLMPQIDGKLEENNPRNYPFRIEDRVLFAGDDPFTSFISTHLNYKPSRETYTTIRYINYADRSELDR